MEPRERIAEIVEQGDYRYYGLRRADDDVAVGDALPCSRLFHDDEPIYRYMWTEMTDEEMAGSYQDYERVPDDEAETMEEQGYYRLSEDDAAPGCRLWIDRTGYTYLPGTSAVGIYDSDIDTAIRGVSYYAGAHLLLLGADERELGDYDGNMLDDGEIVLVGPKVLAIF